MSRFVKIRNELKSKPVRDTYFLKIAQVRLVRIKQASNGHSQPGQYRIRS